jgi:branched-chain amino acid aminotransferase
MNTYYNNNGEIIESTELCLSVSNRGYLYGDGLFESIKVIDGKIMNFSNHFSRLISGAEILHIRVPVYYTQEFFEEKIDELLTLSKMKKGGRVRLSIDRVSGGTYKPTSNEATYFIETIEDSANKFELNTKGIEVDIFSSMRKQINKFSNYKTKNGLIFVMGAIEAQEKGFDDLLITNEKGAILEGTSSNLFVVSNGVLYTPSLSDGCMAGTMRMQVINLALENHIKVYECTIMPQNLLVADEVFFTNAIKGIQWVGGYRTKRYYNAMSKKFTDLLNQVNGLTIA